MNRKHLLRYCVYKYCMHVCGVQLSLVLPYCLIYTRSREREKALFGGPLGVLRPLADVSGSAKCCDVGLSLDRERAWRYIHTDNQFIPSTYIILKV